MFQGPMMLLNAKPPIEVSEVGTGNSGSGATTYNFASVNFGAAASDRLLIFSVHAEAASTNRALASGTIGGIAGTVVDSGGNLDSVGAFLYAVVPTGTSGTVSITFSNSVARAEVWGWRVINLLSATHYDADGFADGGSPGSAAMSVAALADGVAFSCVTNATGTTFTFNNMTRRYTASLNGSGNGAAGAVATGLSAGTFNNTISGSSSDWSAALLTFR